MNHQQRWEAEEKFFDGEEYSDQPIPDATIERYRLCRKPWLPPELPFHLLGDLRGKHVLELGCGDGTYSILLALLGAQVVGVDISSKAIEIARHRAQLHGVTANTSFVAKPLEIFEPPGGRTFDVVCGWAVLHHLIPVLDETLAALARMSSPGAFFLFTEPISLARWLRRLRLMLPIRVYGTPDERPLEPAEVTIIKKHVPDLQLHYFSALLRLAGRLGFGAIYEEFPPAARMAYDALARIDEFCLNRLPLRAFSSVAVMYGRLRLPSEAQSSSEAQFSSGAQV